MKNVLLLFVLLFSYSFINAGDKCRMTRLIGEIKIVDENNNIIQNAQLWIYRTSNDSFTVKKGKHYYRESDTNTFYIYEHHFGYRYKYELDESDKAPEKIYRIQAEGFTDIIIKNIDFIEKKYRDTSYPTLIITLYGKKYIQSNNALTLLDYVTINKTIRVTDSASTLLKDYIHRDPTSSPFEDNFVAKITTYPNPVITELKIQVNYNITEPVQATLSDAQGRKVDELMVEGTMTNVNLESYTPGHYYLTIVNAKGEFLHRQLIIKQ